MNVIACICVFVFLSFPILFVFFFIYRCMYVCMYVVPVLSITILQYVTPTYYLLLITKNPKWLLVLFCFVVDYFFSFLSFLFTFCWTFPKYTMQYFVRFANHKIFCCLFCFVLFCCCLLRLCCCYSTLQ